MTEETTEETMLRDMLRDPGPGACPCPEPLAEAAPVAVDIPRRQGLTLMQLTRRTCRWPLWGKERLPVEKRYYCGKTVAAGVYCTAHCNNQPDRQGSFD
jgi:hypothetical protein